MYSALNSLDIVVATTVFGLVLAIWAIACLTWSLYQSSKKRKVELRLGLLSQQGPARQLRLWHDGKESTTWVPYDPHRLSIIRRLDQLRQEAGWEIPIWSLLLGVFGVSLLASVLAMAITGMPLISLGAAALVVTAFLIYLGHSVNKNVAQLERQLVDALELAARSLRAGHPLAAAFQLIAEDVPAPIGTTFGRICQQQSMGMSLEESLRTTADNSGNTDLKLFATSVIIQLCSGGNLASMMERLAAVIRDRIRLNRRFRTLTAQTQLSKRLLLGLPFLLFVVLNTLNPSYMSPLYDTTTGRTLLAAATASLFIGAWIMHRMAKLKY